MTWFKVGDELTFHPRVLRAGNAAMGLWVRAGAWCSEHLTEGWISRDDARALGSVAEIRKLVAVGLWYEQTRENGEVGYQFHRWLTNGVGDKRQPTRAEVEAEREQNRARQQRWRERKKAGAPPEEEPPAVSGDASRHADVTRYETGDSSVTNGAPVPSRPDPTLETSDEVSPREARTSEPKIVVTEGEWAKWWDTYPRRAGKDRAKPAYKRARQRGATTAQLLQGALRYRDDPNRDPAFTQLPATWLNAGGWDDEPLPPREPAGGSRTDDISRMRDKALAQLDGRV